MKTKEENMDLLLLISHYLMIASQCVSPFFFSSVSPGNFMYFIGYSKWLLLCSRLVAGNSFHLVFIHTQTCVSVKWNCTSLPLGVGAGAGSSIFGFLTQRTQPEERASIFAAIMACRQVGLLVGQPPSFLYLITGRELSFHLPPPPSALVIYRSVRCLLWFAAVPLMPLVFFFSILLNELRSVSPGPVFNLFLRLCDFKLGPFVVNKYTSPGVTAFRSNH